MWFPTTQELIEARFVTRITSFQSRASVEDAMLTGPTSAMYKVIKQYAPEEFDQLIEDMLDVANTSADGEEAYGRAARITAALRQKYAPFAHNAPDESIRAAIELNMEGVRLFAADVKTCNSFVINGPRSLPLEVALPHAAHFGLQSAAVFRALLEGAKAGEPPKIATDEDWGLVGEHWIMLGATDRDIDSISTPTVDDPNLCPAMISMLEAILSAEGPAAERVRASYFAETASN